MACHQVEQNLKLSLPDGSAPYVPLSEIRSRERQQEAYRRALSQKNELFAECHRVRTQITEALDLHEQCSVEWDDLPVSSKQELFRRREKAAKEGTDQAGSGGKHGFQDIPPKEVECMDPAVEEYLLESLESMRKRLIPRLQSLISAAMHVHVESLSDPEIQQRHAVMRHAIDLRNVLQDQRNDITRLGIAPKRRAQDGGAVKRHRAVESTTEVSSSGKDAACRASSDPSQKKRRQDGKTAPDHVLRRLLKTAPNLSEAEAKKAMRSGR